MSLDEFAPAIGIGRGTLVRIENGTRNAKDHELEAMARVSGLPLAFFTTPDLHAALDEESPAPDQLAHLEERVAELADKLDQLQADFNRQAADAFVQALEEPDAPVRQWLDEHVRAVIAEGRRPPRKGEGRQ